MGLIALTGLDSPAAAQRASRDRSQATQTEVIPDGPLTLVVSIGNQRLTVYSGADQVARVPVSTGTRSHPTPTGIFTIIQKNRTHYSNIYNGASMPFMQRLTWSGIALHAGYLPGYPASHGCVRLPHAFAARLFTMTKMGARVIVSHGDPTPTSFQHSRLAALLPVKAAAADTTGAAHASALPVSPMFLGAGQADGSKPAAATVADGPAKSLLRLAQVDVAEKTLALEAAKAVRTAAAQRHDDALHLMGEAREAQRIGNTETARARARLRTLENQLDAADSRVKSSPDDDRLQAALKALTADVEAARAESNEKDETLREIGEEMTDADRNRAAASLALEDAAFRLKLAEEALLTARRDLTRRQQPVSLLVSRKTGKLYVRQGFEPLFEAQISIDEPDHPVGTHVFTALGSQDAPRWTLVSVPAGLGNERPAVQESRRGGAAVRAAGSADRVVSVPPPISPSAALDRVQFPADVLEQLAGMIKPGSSLVITDQPLSRETGKGTDLIVSTN